MPANKNAIARYRALDKCFSDHLKEYDMEKLIKACSVAITGNSYDDYLISKSQIRYDIEYMESDEGYGVELERYWGTNKYGNRVKCFRYKDPNFSINDLPLTEVDIRNIKSAIGILSQFKGLPQFTWMEEVSQKILSSTEASSPSIISFDNNQYLTGINHLGTLYNAILSKSPLSIHYQPFLSETPFFFTIHPHYLKQYNNRWYLFGYEEASKNPHWCLPLDRIQSITSVSKEYIENDTDWDEYFDDIVGVTRPEGESPIPIVLHFSKGSADYVVTKPIHSTQTIKWLDNRTLKVTITVIPNIELQRLLLSFGENVQVITPLSFRDALYHRIQQANALY